MSTAIPPFRRGSTPRWDRKVRLTPFYHLHLSNGAEMVDRDGWLLPGLYSDVQSQRTVLRDGVGMLDISDQGKLDLSGDDIDEVLQFAFPGIGNGEVGVVTETTDGARVYRLTDDQALVLVAARDTEGTAERLHGAADKRECAHVADLTGSLCGLRLVGPNSASAFERLSTLNLAGDHFADGDCAQGPIAKIRAVMSRRDAFGIPAYDLYVDRDLGVYLWDALLEAGTPLGLRPVGLEAEEAMA